MKALTLTQPWAELVRVGAKTIETRSWPTAYRGRLAIHAAKGMNDDARRFAHVTNHPTDRTPGTKLCWCGWDWRECKRQGLHTMPLGAVVATCALVDCVPIIDPKFCEWHSEHERGVYGAAHAAIDGQVIVHRPEAPMHTTVLVEKAWGDYTPGRWAWVLEDVEAIPNGALEPINGRLGLWTWDGAA